MITDNMSQILLDRVRMNLEFAETCIERVETAHEPTQQRIDTLMRRAKRAIKYIDDNDPMNAYISIQGSFLIVKGASNEVPDVKPGQFISITKYMTGALEGLLLYSTVHDSTLY